MAVLAKRFGGRAQQIGVLGRDQARAPEQERAIAIVRKLVSRMRGVAEQISYGVVVFPTGETEQRTRPGRVRPRAHSDRATLELPPRQPEPPAPSAAVDRGVTCQQAGQRGAHAHDQIAREGTPATASFESLIRDTS